MAGNVAKLVSVQEAYRKPPGLFTFLGQRLRS
jgi:hypothetical protein